MMGIIKENTIELTNASHDEVDYVVKWMGMRVKVQTRVLKPQTGIKGNGHFIQGLPWVALRPYAMKLGATFDCIVIDLDPNE